ncbi:hypothetical protein PF003_g19541 [Phytophthora fragariae]|nr:hypothetical protein PF003_g19541 [Phytophthora fragariae]
MLPLRAVIDPLVTSTGPDSLVTESPLPSVAAPDMPLVETPATAPSTRSGWTQRRVTVALEPPPPIGPLPIRESQ